MKTTLSLLVLFALVLGGGYWWSSRGASMATTMPPVTATTTATTTTQPVPGQTAEAAASATPSAGDSSSYTLAQVATHADANSCWATINGNVYNLTTWISRHPGGEARILGICGKDGTKMFMGQHGADPTAQAQLATFKIGTLAS